MKQPYAVVLEDIYYICCAIWSAVVGEIYTPVWKRVGQCWRSQYAVSMGW